MEETKKVKAVNSPTPRGREMVGPAWGSQGKFLYESWRPSSRYGIHWESTG